MKETKHDYQGCLVGNHFSKNCTGYFYSWEDFKKGFLGFTSDSSYDDTYHFVFRWDVNKELDGLYTLELCIMLQRKGIYIHQYIYNINQEILDGEVKGWLKGRKGYIDKLWVIE